MHEMSLQERWNVVRLEKIADVRAGSAFPTKYQGNTQGKYPFYKVSDMNLAGNETLMRASNNWVEDDTIKTLKAKLFPKDTVIFPKVGAAVHTNKKRILSTNSLTDNNVMGVTIRDYNLCLPYYLLYWFEFIDLVDLSNPGPLPAITATTVKNITIPLPPLPEQRAIAHVLQTIQEAKFTRQREIALERERKAALMDYLFSHGTKDEPRKQTEIGEIPESWKTIRFGEAITFTKKPRDLRYSEYNEIPFVPMELIPIAKLFSEEFILKTNEELKSGTYFEPGDILLSKITPSFENGKQCIIPELPTPFGIATTEVIPFHEVVGVSDKFYLFYYLLLPNVRISLAGKMQGTTGRQRLNKEALVNLEIPVPLIPEQRAIAGVFQAIDEKMAALEQEAQHLDALFHAMLDELMTGKTSAVPLIDAELVS